MTSYKLEFLPSALREWEKLGKTVREQFRKKLSERLENPKVQSSRLSGLTDCYKIKLRAVGYRLVYQVDDDKVKVIVIAVGRRDRSRVYKSATGRL